MKNKHLTYEQRYGIEVMLKTKITKKEIYKSLGILPLRFTENSNEIVNQEAMMLSMLKC
jgi:hypothetical protein